MTPLIHAASAYIIVCLIAAVIYYFADAAGDKTTYGSPPTFTKALLAGMAWPVVLAKAVWRLAGVDGGNPGSGTER